MDEIKIRYTWKRKSDGHIWQQIVPIECLEGKGDRPAVLNCDSFMFWELAARDLFTGRVDKNGEEIYENDTLKFKDYPNTYTMGFEEGCFDIINFDNYSHDQQIAFEDGADWEKTGSIHQPPTTTTK